VAGAWEPPIADEYIYVPVPNASYTIRDALRQRSAAFERATCDFLVYQSDDHMFDLSLRFAPHMMTEMEGDVLVPQRLTRLHNNRPTVLPNGLMGDGQGYVPFHGAIYRRAVLEACPWDALVGTMSLDVEHSGMLARHGANALWTRNITLWDVEQDRDLWSS
jgi:hypothetical protein